MTGTISRSIALAKASFSVLRKDREMMLFPILSGIVTLILVASFALPLVLAGFMTESTFEGYGGIVLLFLFYLLSYAVVIYFNTALIACADIRLRGGDPTVGDGFRIATANFGRLLSWAMVAATVGLVLRLISERSEGLGQLAVALVGAAWSLATFFVIPVMVFEKMGVVDAIGESWQLFKRTWGENVVGGFGLGLIMVPGILLIVAGVIALVVAPGTVSIALLSLGVIATVVLAVVYAALQGIFVAVLYRYAKEGTVSPAFGADLVQGAFTPKP
ncbi:hypothetical protein RJ40_08630 [Methanofollis aquaemaris]|uniref:Glycerophosphoryl diester phosphodiesterase membrane domain-containing protein n=1 Tax=Methanofollis aquaemaris TaxID=126734 RepID=A0A8A3S7I1_9EURY|nr:DUF6159 family protein [Methanofollis aquaemaris]QSZ67566.1 hypothetical protein RJ40_08630 [Methanofollis aquaemaris]